MEKQNIRIIDQTPPPERFARGWHTLGLSKSFGDKPIGVNAFGKKLVVFRDSAGKAIALQAACPHMGGDLSMGKIDGDMVRCPYHEWGWGADGKCLDIPYAKKIPKEACIQSWETFEENNLLFIWNDPEGEKPTEEEIIPREEACFSDNWSDWVLEENIININCRELIDNMADMAHFKTVHGVTATKFVNIFDRHMLTQINIGKNLDGSEYDKDGTMESKATYYGPAYMMCWMTNEGMGVKQKSIQLVSHVPIDKDNFLLRHGVLVEKNPDLTEQQNSEMVEMYTQMTQLSFKQDVEIWHNKVRVDNPLLCDGDGPLNKLRDWYNQFYIDRSEVSKSWEKVFQWESQLS